MAEDLLYTLEIYMSEEMKAFRDNGAEYDIDIGDGYVENLHRVRTIALCLYNMEAIPSPRTGRKLKFQDVMKVRTKGVSQNIDYRMIMMYYLEARRGLTEQIVKKPDTVNNPYNALHFLLDTGFSLLSPYITIKEYETWERACDMLLGVDNIVDNPEKVNLSKTKKIALQSKIMHRQGFQMTYRDIDKMGYDAEDDELIEQYKQVKGIE